MSKINGVAKQLSAKISYELEEEKFAPDYYSTLFEETDGIRIEVDFVPDRELPSE